MKTRESVEVLLQFALDYQKVQQTFADLVTGFNAGTSDAANWSKLVNALDDRAVVIGVDHHDKVAIGKQKVIAYLSRQHAQFTPDPNQTDPPVVHGKAAYIGGVAYWLDNDGDPGGDIQFVFGFANRGTNANPNWLAVRLFGSRTSP
jgi:hypothetical protein